MYNIDNKITKLDGQPGHGRKRRVNALCILNLQGAEVIPTQLHCIGLDYQRLSQKIQPGISDSLR